MSESSADEFAASYDPTTPAKPAQVARKKTNTRPVRASSRSAAGPSSKPASGAPKKTASKANGASKSNPEQIVIASSSENEPDVEADEDEEIVAIPGPAKGTSKKGSTRTNTVANGRAKPSAAKGKGKAEPSGTSKATRGSDDLEEPMEVDDVQTMEDHRPAKGSRKPPKINATSARQAKDQEGLLREIESLRRELDSVASERDSYSKQLEELFHIRRTEPEQALKDQAEQFEARLKTQETLIDELNSQLQKVKALGGRKNTYMLHFLTREAADEEKEAAEKEIERWKDIVKQKDGQLADKDKRIVELENQEKLLRSDLAAEIQRGEQLRSRNPLPSATTLAKPVNDPKNGLVIRLYEDMTNFLIVSAKIEKSAFFNLDEPVFTCVYTHREGTQDVGGASLNFSLRETWERPESSEPDIPVNSKDDRTQKVKYQPHNLQNEPEEFVQGLEFFKDAFIFSRDQLPVFLKTLTEKMGGSVQQTDDEEDQLAEDEVIEIRD